MNENFTNSKSTSSQTDPPTSSESPLSSQPIAQPVPARPAPPALIPIRKRNRYVYGALLSRTLPNYTGQYTVGVCDVEIPVETPQTFGTFRHKSLILPNGSGAPLAAGLTLDTVFFTLFYPANPSPGDSSGRVLWFPKLRQTIDGFLRIAKRTPSFLWRCIAYPVAAAAIHGTTFPAHANAPLRPPPPPSPEHPSQWPFILFSHGVGCSRLMYSSLCGELASRGYVVAAIEHRDGTGPSSTITTSDGVTRQLDWLDWRDLEWPDLPVQPTDDTTLRHAQLSFRLAETYEVLKAMQKITHQGIPVNQTSTVNTPNFDWTLWKSVNCDKPIMCGHSLGGSLSLAAATDDRFNFSKIIVFDPAMQRLEPWMLRLHLGIPCPLLCINSEEFVHSREFQSLLEVARRTKHKAVFSIAGSTHPSFSDVFLILPGFINRMTGLKIKAYEMMDKIVFRVSRFLEMESSGDGKYGTIFDGAKVHRGDLGRETKKPRGVPGEVFVHV